MQQTTRQISTWGWRECKFIPKTPWADILAHYGSSVQVADGTNNTPDMRNVTPMGADADGSGTNTSSVTGSALESSNGQVMAHNHSLKVSATGGVIDSVAQTASLTGAYFADGAIEDTGGTKNVPVFRAGYWITRTADWA